MVYTAALAPAGRWATPSLLHRKNT